MKLETLKTVYCITERRRRKKERHLKGPYDKILFFNFFYESKTSLTNWQCQKIPKWLRIRGVRFYNSVYMLTLLRVHIPRIRNQMQPCSALLWNYFLCEQNDSGIWVWDCPFKFEYRWIITILESTPPPPYGWREPDMKLISTDY